jgi:hypothetical protein
MFSHEIMGNNVRLSLAAPEAASDLAHKPGLNTRAVGPQGIIFDILVELIHSFSPWDNGGPGHGR